MQREPKLQLGAALVVLATAIVSMLGTTGCSGTPEANSQESASSVVRAEFNDDGEVLRPDDWRSWIYVGSPLTPNALNNGSAPFPEFHNVYMEPSAFETYQQTGEFPEGTQIAKELVSVVSKDAHSDGSTSQVSGRGYFQSEFQGLELTIKDSSRYPDEPGGWVYFSFGHQAEPYNATASPQATANCNSCHQASAQQDWVFTQFYPVLRSARDTGR